MSQETKTSQDEAITLDEVRSIINARFDKNNLDTFNAEIQSHKEVRKNKSAFCAIKLEVYEGTKI